MTAERLDKIIAGGLLGTVVFAALAHGAVESWSIAIFKLIILLLWVLWVVKCLIEKQIVLKIPTTFWPIAAFLIYGLIQSIATSDAKGQIFSLSFDVEATRGAVIVLVFLLVSHLIAANFFATEKRLQTLVNFLVAFGLVLSVLGLIQYFTQNSIFFWSRPASAVNPWLTGPFINHNHFAGFMELIIPLPLALILSGAAMQARWVYGFAAVIMTIATLLSVSRGGIVSLAAAFLFTAISSYQYVRRKKSFIGENIKSDKPQNYANRALFRNAASVALIVGAIIAGVIWLGYDSILERLPDNTLVSAGENAQTFESSRGWIWKNSFAVFRNNPVFGTGIGTFETAFPQYSEGFQAMPDGRTYVWDSSHNDYLQVLADTGLIGGILALWFLVTVGVSITRSFYLKDRFHAGLAIGCGAAILSLLVHSIFDFNLQLPSTSLLFLILTAVSANLASIHIESAKLAGGIRHEPKLKPISAPRNVISKFSKITSFFKNNY